MKPTPLNTSGRIKRETGTPLWVKQLLDRIENLHSTERAIQIDGIKYQITIKSENIFCEEGDSVCKQEVFCSIHHVSKTVGFLHFILWSCDDFHITNENFFYQIDSNTMEASSLGGTLVSCWDYVGDILSEGAILEFSRLWTSQGTPPEAWVKATDLVVKKTDPERKSILILQAYPLEYEGILSPENNLQEAFKNRQKAMMRHYTNKLKVMALPNDFGEDGWMWKPLMDDISKPEGNGSPLKSRFTHGGHQ